MAKINIYIPDEMKKEMSTFSLPWSEIAQRAFSEAMNDEALAEFYHKRQA